MADIELTLNGDASGATAALGATSAATAELGSATKGLEGDWNKLEAAEKRQAEQLANVKAGFLAVGAAAVKFGIDSVKAYADAERISRQLERAAGDLSGAFEAQADALEASLSVDAELIKQQQTLLLQWGAAPSAIEGTIRAIEDYAAATGVDALDATKQIIKAVETGGAKLKALGYEFETTGDKAKDLTAITAALTAKLGGAAATDAASLQGGINAVHIAFGNLQESFGGVIGAMESKYGVLAKVADAMQRIARGISGASGVVETLGAMTPGGMLASVLDSGPHSTATPAMPDITRGAGSKDGGAAPFSLLSLGGGKTGGKSGGAGARAKEEADDFEQNVWRIVDEQEKVDAALEKLATDKLAFDRKMAKELDDAEAKRIADSSKEMDRASKESMDRSAKEATQARAAGDAIGAAFVNALGDQLSKLASGEEFDVALFVGDILASVISVAGTVIGTAYGQPALGAAVGNLAAMGVRAGAASISKDAKSRKPKTYHDGGWVGADGMPRYHDGTWVGGDEQAAILQHGERVLSRREVGAMGGKRGVDAAASGRGAVNVSIMAIDAKNAAESFMSDLGRGMRQALRSGRGDLPTLMGMPR